MSAQAQQAATSADQPVVEQVVVTGIRASLQQSLTQKRNADSHVEVITAEDVGKMPDKNVADSLQRVPGVNVATAGGTEGGFGDNDRISIRGTPSTLTLTQLNGHTVSSGDWYATNIESGGRSVSYTLLPSEIISRVTVHKGSDASLVEGGAVGTVDIETRKPLDFKQNLTLQGSAESVYSSGAGKYDPQFSGMINWKNDDKTLGILFQAFDEKRTLHREGQEFLWWDTPNNLWGGNTAFLVANPALSGKYISGLTGSTMFDQQRERKGGVLDIQFKPSAGLSVDLNGFYSKLDASNTNTNFMQDTFNSITAGPISPSAYTIKGNTVTSYTMPACPASLAGGCGGISSTVQDIIVRPGAYSDSKFLNLDLKYKVNDDLSFSSKVGTTRGTGHTADIGFEVWGPYTGGSYTTQGLSGAATVVAPGSNVFAAGGAGGGNVGSWGSLVTSEDKETYLHLDGTLATHMEILPTVKFGFRAADHERSITWLNQGAATVAGSSSVSNAPLGSLTNFPSNFGSDLGGSPLAGAWTIPGSAITNWANTYFPTSSFGNHSYQNEFKISEPVQAAYAMANVNADALTGNFGLRLVSSKEQVTNYDKTTGAPLETDNSYLDFLPSANFRLDLNKNLVGRFSVSRTMARPEFGSLGGINLLDIQQTGSGGNPNLKPIRSNNTDLGLEWYFAPKSLLSAGVYYMAFDSYVTYGASDQVFYNATTRQLATYHMSSPVNTTADIKGVELQYEQALFGGFGINANYTYANGQETGNVPASSCASATHNCDMVGTSKNTYNLGAYFENDAFSARLAYNYRSAFLNGLDRNSAIYQDAVGTVSLSLGYAVTKNISLTLEGKDLNDPLLKSYASTPDQPRAFYKNGRQIYLGLRGSM